MPLVDFLHDGQGSDDAKAKMFGRFQSGRLLAMGGGEVAFIKFGSMSAMLCIPGKPTLSVSGFKQMIIIERLVAAHLSGGFEVPTGALVEGSQVKSPADACPRLIARRWRESTSKIVDRGSGALRRIVSQGVV